jgi:diacylglycerol kinase (ATP)
MLYGIFGSKEFFANSQKYLERKIALECDGNVVALPSRLQGLVFLNIPSYMAGTNFWGTEREKRGFSAPSYDDKLVEVVGITGMTQVTTAKVFGIQKQRIAQCRYAKITVHGPDTLPMQVDGEAWLQEPGIIVVSHKNKARMIFKDKTFSQSLESWKLKNPGTGTCPINLPRPVGLLDYLTEEEIDIYLNTARTTRALMELVRQEGASGNADVSRDLVPLLASTSATLDRVFPGEESVSETADLQHLDDFKREMGALMEETLYALDKKKVSSAQAEKMEECVHLLKAYVDAISARDTSATGVFRRASDSSVGRGQHHSSPPAHRERSACMIPDPALTTANVAKRIGKGLCRVLRTMG